MHTQDVIDERNCDIFIICVIFREGIHYALKINKRNSPRKGSGGVPPNLTFLDIVSEFTFRLIHQDKVGKNGV